MRGVEMIKRYQQISDTERLLVAAEVNKACKPGLTYQQIADKVKKKIT